MASHSDNEDDVGLLLVRAAKKHARLRAERDALSRETIALRAQLQRLSTSSVPESDSEQEEVIDVDAVRVSSCSVLLVEAEQPSDVEICTVAGPRVFREEAAVSAMPHHHHHQYDQRHPHQHHVQHHPAAHASVHHEVHPHSPQSPRSGHAGLSPSDEGARWHGVPKGEVLLEASFRSSAPKVYVGTQAQYIKEHIRTELYQAEACMQLPWAIGLFLCFLLAFASHQNVEVLHAIDNAVSFDVLENANFAFSGSTPFENGRMGHKSLQDVNSFADFWSWFNLGLVPLFFPEGWDMNEARTNMQFRCESEASHLINLGFDESDVWQQFGNISSAATSCPLPVGKPEAFFGASPSSAVYLYYNSIVGGVRLVQERSKLGACQTTKSWLPWLADDYGKLWEKVYTGRCVEDGGFWLRPERHNALRENSEDRKRGAAQTEYLLSSSSQRDVRRQLQQLESEVWLGPETSKIELLFTTFNPHQEVFTASYIMFFVNRGGHIHKMIVPVSMWLSPYHGWWNYALDLCWILLVMKLLADEVCKVSGEIRQRGIRKGLANYMSIASCIDLISVGYSALIVYMWTLHLADLNKLKDYIRQSDPHVPGSWEDPQLRADYFEHVSNTVQMTYSIRYVLAFYPFAVVSRFLKACYAQPRLAVAMMTFRKAAVDLLHFSIFFLGLCAVYALSAMILFGQELEEFANWGRCFTSVICILCGDFDWERLHQVGRIQAGVWLGTFIGGVNLVVLNMVLAIIMDMYTEMKSAIGSDAETLPSQAMGIWKRWRGVGRGELVPLEKILYFLEPDEKAGFPGLPDDEELSAMRLVEIVPDMRVEQATELILAAHVMEELEDHTGSSMTEATVAVQEMRSKVDTMLEFMSTKLSGHRADMPNLDDVCL